jgi:hypothetical protein
VIPNYSGFFFPPTIQNYFDFCRANLNGEKNIESFIGSGEGNLPMLKTGIFRK